jgi:hypothetical protein
VTAPGARVLHGRGGRAALHAKVGLFSALWVNMARARRADEAWPLAARPRQDQREGLRTGVPPPTYPRSYPHHINRKSQLCNQKERIVRNNMQSSSLVEFSTPVKEFEPQPRTTSNAFAFQPATRRARSGKSLQ